MEHLETIMRTTLENLKEMVDVNTVIGNAVTAPDGSTIIPFSKVSFGFVAGGGEYSIDAQGLKSPVELEEAPFAGGAGAGVSVVPSGFLVVSSGGVRMIPAYTPGALDRLIEMIPNIACELKKAVSEMCKCSEKLPDDEPSSSDEFAI